jgi:hypothetical protein
MPENLKVVNFNIKTNADKILFYSLGLKMKENLHGNSVRTSASLFVCYVKHFSQETKPLAVFFSLLLPSEEQAKDPDVSHTEHTSLDTLGDVYIFA